MKKVATSRARCAVGALCVGLAWAAWAQKVDPPAVDFFSPQGTVKGVRQASARFASAMVPFGDPREIDPFDIQCPEKGKGRWADMRNWVYDFDRDLPAGVRCSFTLKSGLTALDGKPLAPGAHFEFSTGGPAIVRSLPYEGARIDENQIFILGLDAPIRPATVLAHAHCVAAGVNEEIPVRLLTGAERKTILDSRKDFAASYLRFLFLDAREGTTRAFLFRLPPAGSDDEKFRRLRDAPDSPLVTLACARTLPNGVEAKLVWGKGIAATTGVVTTSEQALAFKVRPTFRASFSCSRVNKDAQCIPIQALSLTFTAPVAYDLAAKIRLVDGAGKAYAARISGTGTVETVTFGPVLPEQQTFKLEIPAGLVDDSGRPLENARSFPLTVRTDEYPPLVKFAAPFGILEAKLPAGEKTLLPLTVRNVEPTLSGALASVPPQLRSVDKAADAKSPIPGQIARIDADDDLAMLSWLQRLEDADKIEREFDENKERWLVKRYGAAYSVFDTKDVRAPISVPKPNGGRAFEVVGIPLPKPGFYVVELASPKLGAALLAQKRPYYVRSSALVTNLGVHFKLGRESSLAWVTHLDDATPAPNARVTVRDCFGHLHWEGRADGNGIARIPVQLPPDAFDCHSQYGGYYVIARADGDTAFTFSAWGEGISPWRFNVPTGNYDGPYVAHAVLDRSLLRAGETVSMKVFLREQTGQGFALAPRDRLEDTLVIRHMGTDREYSIPVRWNTGGSEGGNNGGNVSGSGARGVAHGEASFAIPKDAALGTYRIFIKDTLALRRGGGSRAAGTFRVEQFRIPLMRARISPVGAPLVNPDDVRLDLQVSYLAGGGAGGLPVKLRTQIEGKIVTFPDYDDYAFAAGNVREGREERGATSASAGDYDFNDPDMPDEDAERNPVTTAKSGVSELPVTLDAAGGARATVKNVGKSDSARDMVAEMEYRDPNGETLTAAARIALWPSSVILGIKPDGWAGSKDRLKFSVVALDLRGAPVAGLAVRADGFQRAFYSHRRRLIGGFYAFDQGSETKQLGELCAGTTDARGLLICEVAPPATGSLIVRAIANDPQGGVAVTRADAFVASGDDDWYGGSDNDRIDLLPEKKRYEPGDTARLQVRTPFKEATVLVTVEREGVLDAFVRTVRRGSPTIEVPIKPEYSPNVFISAFVVRGRIDGIAPTALIDLAKPAYKMGLAEVRVGWSAHELVVKVKTDREAYKVRDKAKATISVRRPDGSAPPKGTEVALAAVDEGLLELLPNDSWKLLEAMMTRRGEEVATSTAQTQVIGKRHFGRKAIAAGGGGGRGSSRELFDTLLLWKARVALDDAGNATVEVPLNDSLTSFRIVAVADSGAQLFGTGSASIRSTQDLMLLSGLPPLVREGDVFRAIVTVRNTAEKALAVSVSAATQPAAGTLSQQQVLLAPGEAREIAWTLTVPVGATKLDWQITASTQDSGANASEDSPLSRRERGEGSSLVPGERGRGEGSPPARDALKISQSVIPAVPERTYQATITQLNAAQAFTVQRPVDAIPGRGGVDVRVQAKLGGDLPGVREFFNHYPYSCLEQRVSIAVGLQSRALWDAAMSNIVNLMDRDGLLKYWAFMRDGDDALTAYVLSIADEAGWEIPPEARARIEAALVGFVEGRVVRYSALQTADLAIRKMTALEALSRGRTAFNPKWLDSIGIEPNLWPTSAVIDWYLVLKRQPKLARRDERMHEAEQILRSRLNFQGTTMGFSTEKSDALWWLMISADANANKLLIALSDVPAWREDVPRMVTGSLLRMQRGHWNTTVANAWGVLAMKKFSLDFEKTPVTGATAATLDGVWFEHAWKPDDGTTPFHQLLPWPRQAAPLKIAHAGDGRPWAVLSSIAAIPLTEPLSTGYKVTKAVTPVSQKIAGPWSRGDVARIHLEVEAQADMTWVVVDDPIPAGSTALGAGLGGDSTLMRAGEKRVGTVWPAYEERTFAAFHAYYRYVPKGKFVVEYSVRLNNPGEFNLPATRVEAMYAPEMFGELPNAQWKVAP
ncbi:MAG: alpha-2-macroglobulin family protein [Betaproteobacteria bacterium]